MPSQLAPTLPPDLLAVFSRYPEPLKRRLMAVRALVFDTATEHPAIGQLLETLKWGAPAYLTQATQSGTTLRVDQYKNDPERYALFVHCQSRVMAQFKVVHGDTFSFDGDRAVILSVNDPLPESAIREFIYLTLTYHLRQKNKVI